MASPPTDCPKGELFYVCNINQFRGCCPWDPCSDVAGCTKPPSPHGITITSSISFASSISPISSVSTSVPTSVPTPATVPSIATPGKESPTPTTLPSPSAGPNADLSPNNQPQEHTSNRTALFVGVGVGTGMLFLLSFFAVWFWMRRRKNADDTTFVMCTSNADEGEMTSPNAGYQAYQTVSPASRQAQQPAQIDNGASPANNISLVELPADAIAPDTSNPCTIRFQPADQRPDVSNGECVTSWSHFQHTSIP
ncbi:hypothetical protein PG990_001589 [Apiospora arundinis]|uniref:Di-copper centre-containing protein n=1 Tax=Apiospora arundinis TaxID=335852 RepID=A0ABR2HSK2_9PEZI